LPHPTSPLTPPYSTQPHPTPPNPTLLHPTPPHPAPSPLTGGGGQVRRLPPVSDRLHLRGRHPVQL
jgi:hypothetical protein